MSDTDDPDLTVPDGGIATDDDADLRGQLRAKLAQVDALLETGEGDLLPVLREVLAIAETGPGHRSLVLGYMFSRAVDFRDAFKAQGVPESFYSRCRIIDAHLEFVLNENPTAPEFYSLLDGILDIPQLATPEYRALALYWLVIDNRLPYFQLPSAPGIPEEEWQVGLREHNDDFRLIHHVFARNITSKWRESGMLRQILETRGATVEDQNFLLIFIINWAEDRGYRRGLAERERD